MNGTCACDDLFNTFLMTPPYMSFSQLLSCKPQLIFLSFSQPTTKATESRCKDNAEQTFAVTAFTLSNCFVDNYELYKASQEEQNKFTFTVIK